MLQNLTGLKNVITSGLVSTTLVTIIAVTSASAGEGPSAEEIQKAVSDHTYQGSMSAAASGFAEYYAPDGSIKADGYSGKWRTEDSTMCFQYGDNAERCFGVEMQGPSMVMIKNDNIDGNGMLISGNVNNF